MKRTSTEGFTLIELLIVLAIAVILFSIVISSYIAFSRTQAIEKDAHLIVSILDQAHSQTISSYNATQYGVHFASTTATLFTGSSYSAGNSSNVVTTLNSRDSIYNLNLTGGGNDVLFSRLSGETSQSGSLQIKAVGITSTASTTKTVTIYKTGISESN